MRNPSTDAYIYVSGWEEIGEIDYFCHRKSTKNGMITKTTHDTPHGPLSDLLFDLGNVLVKIDVSRTVRAFRRLGIENLSAMNVHPDPSGVLLEYELGKIGDGEFVQRIQGMLPDPEIPAERIREAWNAMILPPDPERFRRVQELRKKGYGIYVLSNTNRFHIERGRESVRESVGIEFEAMFDGCFYSHELRMRKPSPEIFREAARLADLDPRTTLFIDDNGPNLHGAAEAGFQTFLLGDPEDFFSVCETL